MAPLINYGETSHWYTRDGSPKHDADLRVARKQLLYPSTTTVDKAVFRNPFLEKWFQEQILIAAGENPKQPHETGKDYAQRVYDLAMEYTRNAAMFGNRIHEMVEKYPSAPKDTDLNPWFTSFSAWFQASGITPIQQEKTVVCHQIGIAGRMDLIGSRAGTMVAADWKSQNVKVNDKGKKTPAFYDSWVRQLAFYGSTEARQDGQWTVFPACLSVVIDSNPEAGIYAKWWTAEEVKEAYRSFIHGAWMFFDSKGYWPVGKWYPGHIDTERIVTLPV